MGQFGYQQPLNPFNYTKVIEKLEKCKTYIMNLQFLDRGLDLWNLEAKLVFLGLS